MTRPLVCIVLLGSWAFRIRNMHTKLDGFNVFGKGIINNWIITWKVHWTWSLKTIPVCIAEYLPYHLVNAQAITRIKHMVNQ